MANAQGRLPAAKEAERGGTLHHNEVKLAAAIVFAVLLTIVLVGLAAGVGRAAELVDIVAARPCSAIAGDRVSASGNCSASDLNAVSKFSRYFGRSPDRLGLSGGEED
jgi:hypothetical protein